MNHSDFVSKYLKGVGAEIGAFESPIPGIEPIYIDKFAEFAGRPCKADFFGETCSLPFEDNSLDYLASSHVLEHTANPVLALVEAYRVLKPDGIAYLIVPDKRFTWDRNRTSTPVSHLLDDYRNGQTEVDGTHIDDFVFGVVWEEMLGEKIGSDLEKQRKERAIHYRDAISQGLEINIHQHVFEPGNFRETIEEISRQPDIPCRWEILEFEERFPSTCPNGILAIIRKTSGNHFLPSLTAHFRKLVNRNFPLRKNAIRFSSNSK